MQIKNMKCPKNYCSSVSILKQTQKTTIAYLFLLETFNTARRECARNGDARGESIVLADFKHVFMSKQVSEVRIHNDINNKLCVICIRRAISDTAVYLKYLKNQIKIMDAISAHKIIKLKSKENEPSN